MISSLDGNDVFAMSRIYEQKYRDELKDYVEVTPPLLLNVAGVTVETGSSSFKEFMILFDKIYEGTKTIGSKKQMDPQTQKSDEIRELSISKFDTEFNFDAAGVAKITERTGPKVGEIVDKGVIQIQVEEDYLTRVGMYNVIDKKWSDWIEEASNYNKTTASTERKQRIQDIQSNYEVYKANRDIFTKFDKVNSTQTKSGIYDEYTKLNVNINNALVRMETNFVPWSKIIRSNEVKYNQTETENKIDKILDELSKNIDKDVEITGNVSKNMLKLGNRMKKLPASNGETVAQIKNEIISDPQFLKYNKADYDLPTQPATPPPTQPATPPPTRKPAYTNPYSLLEGYDDNDESDNDESDNDESDNDSTDVDNWVDGI